MILPLIFLLASLLQQYGSEAESSHVSKLNPPSVKEQNGEFPSLFVTFRKSYLIEHKLQYFSRTYNDMLILTGLGAILLKMHILLEFKLQ